jgi:GNAT superfamily N-acetyltransferase
MIRVATAEDHDGIMAMARRFLSADGPYGDRFTLDEERVSGLTHVMVGGADHLVLVADVDGEPVGMLVMFVFAHPLTGEQIASELCWWMEPEFRSSRLALKLLRDGEAWAKKQGAAVIEMIAPNERVAEFYGHMGYERTDVHYRKTL